MGIAGSLAQRRRLYVDVVVAAVVLVLSLLPLAGVGDSGCDCPGRPWWAYLAVILQSVPLVWRRRWPFSVGLVVLGATVVYGIANLPDPVVPFGVLVSLYSVAAYARPVLSYVSLAGGIVAVPVAVLLSTTSSDALDYINPLFELVTAWSLGFALSAHRQQAQALVERTRQLERAVAAEAAALAAQERERIAAEMHDVVAHAVTLMVVQAEAGPVAVESGRAEATFDSISRIGRQALAELRRVLTALRPPDVGTQRTPQPDVAELAVLIDDAVAAGLPAELDIQGDITQLPRPVTLAAFRIVQESLTNAVRYGGGARTRVVLRVSDTDLEIQVETDRDSTHRRSAVPGAGHGVPGMQARARALGGSLEAGAAMTGGWRVHATLPLAPAVSHGRRATPEQPVP